MPGTKLEHDPLFELITDALRAGPDSPQWHEAVQRLREADSAVGDEFALLSQARERLAQGREFRSLRAGPTFTRRLLDRLEEEASQVNKGLPWASVIAIVSLIVMVSVVASLVAYLIHSSTPVHRVGTEGGKVFAAHEAIVVEMVIDDWPPDTRTPTIIRVQALDYNDSAMSLQWMPDELRLDGDEGILLYTARVQSKRLRLVVDSTLVKIEADGRPLWTGKHGLPDQGSRGMDLRIPPGLRQRVQVTIKPFDQVDH